MGVEVKRTCQEAHCASLFMLAGVLGCVASTCWSNFDDMVSCACKLNLISSEASKS